MISEIFNIKVGGNLVEIGKFWLSSKKHGLLNIITSGVLWCIWKHGNEICFQNAEWRGMEMLLFQIGGLLQNWVVLCAPEKKERLLEFLNKIKAAARTVLWISYAALEDT
ncbi:hypothetical protein BDA96_01G427500 [Sorghum bicolor]|jgi:hypothetical protein|uniref:Uncharacterized protein n=2 Tax=Sorghum bicolor TaxID=4558 RepID=A0A921S586_SORBI|nr:hypothetical protein BDA96_01G427500 [Sorghum bicolor]OQU92742.1 hypothetical protein SORBI_3001G401750 [Sorghum bicolor]